MYSTIQQDFDSSSRLRERLRMMDSQNEEMLDDMNALYFNDFNDFEDNNNGHDDISVAPGLNPIEPQLCRTLSSTQGTYVPFLGTSDTDTESQTLPLGYLSFDETESSSLNIVSKDTSKHTGFASCTFMTSNNGERPNMITNEVSLLKNSPEFGIINPIFQSTAFHSATDF
jgi:hypothetical protein